MGLAYFMDDLGICTKCVKKKHKKVTGSDLSKWLGSDEPVAGEGKCGRCGEVKFLSAVDVYSGGAEGTEKLCTKCIDKSKKRGEFSSIHHEKKASLVRKADAEPARDRIGQHGYIGLYRGKQYEVYADSSYAAQQKLAKQLGVKKSYEISVYLCEKNVDPETGTGEQVTHTPTASVRAKKAAVDAFFRGAGDEDDDAFFGSSDEQAENPTPEEDMEPSPEDYTISDSGPLGSRTSVGQIEGKHLGEFNSDEEAIAAIRADMEKHQFYPNVWRVSDHGNWSIMDISEHEPAPPSASPIKPQNPRAKK